jgi:hypothetical protein
MRIQDNILMVVLCIQDNINNWRTTALILTTIFFPAAAIWFIGKSSLKPVDPIHKSHITNFFAVPQEYFCIVWIDLMKKVSIKYQG